MEVGRYVKDYVGNTERLEYVWQDNLGSRRAVTDTAGTVKAKIDYAVWGGSTVTNYNGYDGSQDVSYTGKERDGTGLYYYNARYYDCVAGRFYSEDPVRDGGNWFVYCGNNPLSLADKDGRNPVKPTAILGMAAHTVFERYAANVLGAKGQMVFTDDAVGSIRPIVDRIMQIPSVDEESNLLKRPDVAALDTTDGSMQIYELKPMSCKDNNYKHDKAVIQLNSYMLQFRKAERGASLPTEITLDFPKAGKGATVTFFVDNEEFGLYYYTIDDGVQSAIPKNGESVAL